MPAVYMNTRYPFQVWLTSVSIAPLLQILLLVIFGDDGINAGIIFLYFYFVIFGAALSLPILFIFYLAFREFHNTTISDNIKKILLSLIAIAAMCVTFYLIIGKEAFSIKDDYGITIILSYAVSIIISTFIYRLSQA
jgi:hypothetical protein